MVFFHAVSCVSLCDFNLYKSVKKFKQEKTCHMQSTLKLSYVKNDNNIVSFKNYTL